MTTKFDVGEKVYVEFLVESITVSPIGTTYNLVSAESLNGKYVRAKGLEDKLIKIDNTEENDG